MKKDPNADYGYARTRDLAFDAIMRLWELRKRQGVTQAQLAAAMGRDPAWVSRYLRGPGNWTLRTIGAFITGLDGEFEISAHPLEEPLYRLTDYHLDTVLRQLSGSKVPRRLCPGCENPQCRREGCTGRNYDPYLWPERKSEK